MLSFVIVGSQKSYGVSNEKSKVNINYSSRLFELMRFKGMFNDILFTGKARFIGLSFLTGASFIGYGVYAKSCSDVEKAKEEEAHKSVD